MTLWHFASMAFYFIDIYINRLLLYCHFVNQNDVILPIDVMCFILQFYWPFGCRLNVILPFWHSFQLLTLFSARKVLLHPKLRFRVSQTFLCSNPTPRGSGWRDERMGSGWREGCFSLQR